MTKRATPGGAPIASRTSDEAIRREVVPLLRDLIRVDTVSPPGNETAAVRVLQSFLDSAGVRSEILAREPTRANLVARLPGSDRRAGRLLYLAHLDTVGANRSEWTVDPWDARVADGAVWGRGALDMKHQAAAVAVALAVLNRARFRPQGDLVFAACADEELGESDVGLPWLCSKHPDSVRADYCVNEGLGTRLEAGDQTYYLYSAGEKRVAPFKLTIRGTGGHASQPHLADNALTKAGRALGLVERIRLRPHAGDTMRAFFSAVGVDAGAGADAPSALLDDPKWRDHQPMLLSKLHSTFAPTMAAASAQRNVIPSSCEITFDCRVVSDADRHEVERGVRASLGAAGIDHSFQWLEGRGGSSSPADTPLSDAILRSVRQLEPEACIAPMLMDAFTDSHHVRAAFDTVAYGFFPFPNMRADQRDRLLHAPDERILIDDLVAGTRCLIAIAEMLAS